MPGSGPALLPLRPATRGPGPALALLLLLVPAGAATAGPRTYTFRAQWAPQAQFAGYYVALARGFYERAGLRVEIRPGGPGIAPLVNVAAGQDTFGSDWLMSGIVMASKGAPVVHVAQLLQTSGLVLVTTRGSGITHPRQMGGRTVGVWPGLFAVPPAALFRKFAVQPRLVSQGFAVSEFLEGRLDVASAMTYNEYPLMLASGRGPDDLVAFHFKDFDLNFPEDGLYVHADTLRADPEGCRAFVRASLQGWLHAFAHPEEAVAIVIAAATQARTRTTAAHQARMLAEIRRLALHRVGPAGLGQLDPQAFRFVHEVLRERGYLPRPVALESFHRPLCGP